jgi:hypothetical protein
MEEVLVVLFQFLFELILNVLSNLPFEWPSKGRQTPERESIWPVCAIWFMVGCGVGGMSLLLVGYALLQPGWLRIANLVLSPIASGLIAKTLAEQRAPSNPMLVPRNHFWYAFWFSLGVAFTRFAYATRA